MRSGDVAIVLPNGAIKIVDRAKNIFKLSFGEYVAPEKLENVYVQSEWIEQVWIYGDAMRDFVLAFISVNPRAVEKYCEKNNKQFTRNDDFLKDKDIKNACFMDLIGLAAKN